MSIATVNAGPFNARSTKSPRSRRGMILVGAIAGLTFGLAGWANPAACRADQPLPLAAAVAAAARTEIVPTLEREGVKSVGVLKFLAVEGTGPEARPSTKLGSINSDLAAQFQTAILLNLSRKTPIAVLRDPAAVVANIPDATHLSAEGLKKLFAAEYPVVVGKPADRVKPDALIFGIVQIADDLRTVGVDVRLVGKGEAAARQVCTFTARLGAEDLSATGQSFVATRGMFSGGQTAGGGATAGGSAAAERPIRLASLAADVRKGRRAFPLEDPDAPVTLSISYDGVVQRIEQRNGGAFVVEPRQGQNVTVTLNKAAKDGRRYAVALKVNGENTAERSTLPDIKASKWILSDSFMTLPVKGYSAGTESEQPFVVLSESESAKRAFDYGVDAGTITMTVFAEQTGPSQPEDVPSAEPLQVVQGGASAALDQLLLGGGVRLDPKQTFDNLDAAKGSLQSLLASANRGLIVADSGSRQFKTRIEKFELIPDPVMSVVIRYYTRR